MKAFQRCRSTCAVEMFISKENLFQEKCTWHGEEDGCGSDSQKPSKSLAVFHKYLFLFAAELQRYCLVLQDRTSTVKESFGLFIGAVKPLEQESNHLKQIGNVPAALVKAQEKQSQAARRGRGKGKDTTDADDRSAFLSG